MELINPNMLWGLLAISTPILIHFWNQKKATLVNWAAMKWLVESQKLKAKGFRFEDLLLLFLRILAIALISLILAQPLLKNAFLPKNKKKEKVHILEKRKEVLENFKFEINQALENNEPVFLANDRLEKIKTLENINQEKDLQGADLQRISNIISSNFAIKEIHYYLLDNKNFNEYPNVFLRQNFKIHLINNDINNKVNVIHNGDSYLFVNEQLEKSKIVPSGNKILEKNKIIVAIKTADKEEYKNIKAAFEAIGEVYGFNFIFDEKNPDIAIGQLKTSEKSDLRIQTGSQILIGKYYDLNQKLNSKSSSLVYQAQLPERILEILLRHFEMENTNLKMSQKQLNSIFQKAKINSKKDKTSLDKYLIFLLLITITVERWISLKNNK